MTNKELSDKIGHLSGTVERLERVVESLIGLVEATTKVTEIMDDSTKRMSEHLSDACEAIGGLALAVTKDGEGWTQ